MLSPIEMANWAANIPFPDIHIDSRWQGLGFKELLAGFAGEAEHDGPHVELSAHREFHLRVCGKEENAYEMLDRLQKHPIDT